MHAFAEYAIDAVSLGSLYALFALGIALIFGIMGLINFAHSGLIMAGAFALAMLSRLPLPVTIALCIAFPVALALLMDRAAFRPIRGAHPATLLVASFAVSILLENAANLLFGTLSKGTNVSSVLITTVHIGSVTISVLNILTITLTAVLLALLALFFRRTSLGVQMRAAAEDFEMARLLGVRGNRVVAMAFAISGALAGCAALLLVAQTGAVDPTIGITPVLYAFVATILGGLGSLSGAVIGGMVLGILTVVLQATLPTGLQPFTDTFVFTGIFILLMIRPRGLIVPRLSGTRV